jgi:hypothetical protein
MAGGQQAGILFPLLALVTIWIRLLVQLNG